MKGQISRAFRIISWDEFQTSSSLCLDFCEALPVLAVKMECVKSNANQEAVF